MSSQNYKPAIYSVEIDIEKPLSDVFNHVLNLSKWWPEEFTGESHKLNAEFELRTGDSHYSKNKVIEFVPNTKFAWLTTESIRKSDNYDWAGTKFIFELSSRDKFTHLRFIYDGVVLENELGRLAQICDLTIKDMFYNSITIKK